MSSLLTTRLGRECGTCELRGLRVFCNLDTASLADFELIGVQATLPRGAKVFREDEPSNGVFVLCTGQVKLSCTSKEGKTLILKIAMPGDVLGLGRSYPGRDMRSPQKRSNGRRSKAFAGMTSLRLSGSTGRQACMLPKLCQRSIKLRSSMPVAWRCPVQPRAGWRVSCSTGERQRHAASPRCGSLWRLRMRNWPTW